MSIWLAGLEGIGDAAGQRRGRQRVSVSRVRAAMVWRSGGCSSPQQPVAGEDIVGQSVQPEHGVDLLEPADGELIQAPVPEPGIDTFAHGAPPVDTFPLGAAHSRAPGRHAGTIVGSRRIWGGIVLVADRRATDLDIASRRPFDVPRLRDAAVDDAMAVRQSSIAPGDARP